MKPVKCPRCQGGGRADDEWVPVQVTDSETGDVETVELRNDYVVVDGSCYYVAHTQVFGNGTHVLRIKGCWP